MRRMNDFTFDDNGLLTYGHKALWERIDQILASNRAETPFRVFIRELKQAGLDLGLYFGRNGFFDPVNRAVIIGTHMSQSEVGIIGLHELGHAKTAQRLSVVARFNLARKLGVPVPEALLHEMYSYEVAAWKWAESKMPPGYSGKFEALRQEGLSSYYSTPSIPQRG